MAQVDLHVHSKYSDHPSEWFLQRIGASESYTEPEDIYAIAKAAGMRYVTITDHNTIEGALELVRNHPGDCFVSVESTAYFPEDKCKVHILLYGIDRETFAEIERLRMNIYELRDYIRENDIACSVAHATYAVNSALTVEHLEKLILLFDVFEIVNGGRSRVNNQPWEHILKSLTPDHIEMLTEKHGIEPFSDTPWVKGYTGGSDDHAGLFIGRACTAAHALTIDDFLGNIRGKMTVPEGRYNNFRFLAFAVYKIAYDFSRAKSDNLSQSLVSQITELLFDDKSQSVGRRLKLSSMKRFKRNGSSLRDLYLDLYETMIRDTKAPVDEKLERFYIKLGDIADEFFRGLLASFESGLERGDIPELIRNITSSMPGIFLTAPFFSTLTHFSQGRHLVSDLARRLSIGDPGRSRKILWFTDTIADLNGVSMIVKKLGWLSYLKGREVRIVTSLPDDMLDHEIPPNTVNLPSIFEFKMPHYEEYTLRIPAILKALDMLSSFEPDEIYISTPGPVGAFGLLMARVFNARSVGIFHTDFTLQAHEIVNDGAIDDMIENSVRWFYSRMDEIKVPTAEYIRILAERGYDESKMSVFRRGIDTFQFSPRATGRDFIRKRFGVRDEIVLVFAGRVSKDKNLDFLISVFKKLRKNDSTISLMIVGDGPYLASLIGQYEGDPSIVFTGRLGRELLPELYSGSDIFVFPSTTDTFGMVVIEAQSCGLPAVVSNKGGPKELVIDTKTGYVVPTDNPLRWEETLAGMIDTIRSRPEKHEAMRKDSRRNVLENSDWDLVLREITETVPAIPVKD